MKKITAILLALLLIITFISCVDNKVSTEDVRIPGRESSETSSETKNPSSNSGNPGYVDSDGKINLPTHIFTKK